jgi:CRP-like cAMP-binding protein
MAAPATASHRDNRLLSLLDDATLDALAPDLEWTAMHLHDVAQSHGKAIRHAWFPVEGVISMLAAPEEGRARVEIGTVGREGMAGLAIFLGAPRATGDAFVQVEGAAWRMPAAAFQRAAGTHSDFAAVLHRYMHALFVQVSQSSACNRQHTPLQRCARWLLMTHDRVQSDTFGLKQEFLAQMLGERRPTVSRVQSELQDRRMISYSRGRITIESRDKLEDMACGCYRVIRDEYDAMLKA